MIWFLKQNWIRKKWTKWADAGHKGWDSLGRTAAHNWCITNKVPTASAWIWRESEWTFANWRPGALLPRTPQMATSSSWAWGCRRAHQHFGGQQSAARGRAAKKHPTYSFHGIINSSGGISFQILLPFFSAPQIHPVDSLTGSETLPSVFHSGLDHLPVTLVIPEKNQ